MQKTPESLKKPTNAIPVYDFTQGSAWHVQFPFLHGDTMTAHYYNNFLTDDYFMLVSELLNKTKWSSHK